MRPRPTPNSSRTARLARLAAPAGVAIAAAFAVGCGDDDPATGPDPLPLVWEFDGGLDGWSAGNAATGVNGGAVSTENGEVILRGWGDAGVPDAWISRALTLPGAAFTITVRAVADCILQEGGGDSALRVLLVAGGNTTVLLDWTTIDEDTYDTRSADLDAFAGQAVTIRVEMDDEGEQEDDLASGETLCIDRITITGD